MSQIPLAPKREIFGWAMFDFANQGYTLLIITVIFGFLQSRLGACKTYIITLSLWLLAILSIWQTPALTSLVRAAFAVDWEAQYVFLFAGALAGVSLGSSQSAARALVGVLTPPGKSAEFFGFWGMAAKLAAVFGILGLGLIQWALGLADAIVLCLALFVLAIFTVLPVNELRGAQAADAWRDEA